MIRVIGLRVVRWESRRPPDRGGERRREGEEEHEVEGGLSVER